jgi:uncharacterized protein (UPF0261 family)
MVETKPTVVCMGILDTKEDEIRFLAQEIRRQGADVKIMDLSLGAEASWADIPLSQVLEADGKAKEDVFKSSRSEAAAIVGQAGARKMRALADAGRLDGVIAWGGGMGTSVATRVMRALPIGFPKIMMCTLASGDVSKWLGNKDIYIMNPIAEKGINRITRQIVNKAAGAIVGMAAARRVDTAELRPLAALTVLGVTTQAVTRCARFIEEKGWDTIFIHQVGTGATMEDLIRAGEITAVYDITTGELSNTLLGSMYGISETWEGERLTAASDMGIPQVVCPGGLAECAYGALETLPQSYVDDFKSGRRVSHQNSGKPYCHSESVTVLTPTLDETRALALEMITKLNKTTGPTAVVVPMRGWSAYDQAKEVASLERGWPQEKGDAPAWWPEPEKPSWSRRATTLWSVFEQNLAASNPNLDVIHCDMHLLDEAFADLLNRCMGDMLEGKWRKGRYRDTPGVLMG